MSGEQYKGRFVLLFTCFVGIFCSYLANGLVVEKIARGNAFQYYTSIVMVTTIANTVVAKLLLVLKAKKVDETLEQDKTRISPRNKTILLVLCSLSYIMSMMTANASLKYVNYPTQIVGKSGKPVIILMMSIALINRRYNLRKCVSIFFVVVGVSLFMLENARGRHNVGEDKDQNSLGVLLVISSLFFDGIVAIAQDKLREVCHVSASEMMYNINKWAAFLMFCIATVKGELLLFIDYCRASEWFLLQMVALCISGALGQQFIFLTVVNFGPLVCSVITTTRKFFTILLSTLIFQHILTLKHWACVCMVFFGLVTDFW